MGYELVAAGADASAVAVGDFILVARSGPVSALIRIGQSIRPAQRPWRRLTHVAFIASVDGDLIEADWRGVARTHLSAYRQKPYVHVSAGLAASDQAQAKAFAESCVGQSYGRVVILGCALRMLTPGRGLWFGMNGTEICSGLQAQALCRGDAIFKANPASMIPAELAAAYHVAPI